MSHIISKEGRVYKRTTASGTAVLCVRDGRLYKSSTPGGTAVICVRDGRVYKSSTPGGTAVICVRDGKIYKSSTPGGSTLNINSDIYSAIKDSKNHDLAVMVAVYHILIKPIF